MAVQLGSGVKPLTVKRAGAASLARALAGVTTPLSQTRETVTVVVSVLGLSVKSLKTVNVSPLRVLVIVHWPTAMSAASQVPLEV